MKLHTTIAAVLISISAFSQDYIEYDNGTFTQNGEELSLKQINDMTISYNVGKKRLARAVKLKFASTSSQAKFLNSISTSVGYIYIGLGFTIWWPWSPNDRQGFIFNEGDFDILGQISVVIGTALVLRGKYNMGPLEKADKNFSLVAQQLNEAIKATNR